MIRLCAIAAALAIVCATTSHAENWPQFRGPTGLGYSTEKDLPLTWSAEDGTNVMWKSPLRGEGHASPVVWGDRVFVCTVQWPDGTADRKKVIPDHFVTCYSTKDGSQLWQTQIEPGPWVRSDFRSGAGGGYAAPTPCVDADRVYVVFGSSVIAALDHEGKLAWRQSIEPYTFDVTIGTSPVFYKDTIVFVCMMAKKPDSRIVAFDRATGHIKWEAKEPFGFGHSTPVITPINGKDQMLVLSGSMGIGGEALQSFDPATGERLWWCAGGGESSSPAVGHGLVFFDSGRGGNGTAVDPTGAGDVSATHVRWTTDRYGEAIGSPIIVGDYVYRVVSGGVLKCWNVTTGEAVYTERIPVSSTWASPIATADGRLYFASAGKSAVVKAGPKFELLASNDLGDANHPTPAISNGRIYMTGMTHLWCVGSK
ncbi:MAG: PQQ-binding-like beta-propeller repeat protein [Phycisphaera sp.]|nr:PQQ-binding-like beta-propeller repeat protein [Phycisphaera sp.]